MPLRATIIALALLLSACTPPASARFEVDGVSDGYSDCFDVVFPFVPIFHAYRSRETSAALFFQSRGGNMQFADLVYIAAFEPDNIELGTPIAIDPLVGPETEVSVSVSFGESCPIVGRLGTTAAGTPRVVDVPDVLGTVTFTQFSQEVDGIIAGTLDGSLVHPRNGETVAESFTGEFEFTVQVGQPYEEFRN